ncbi:MAG: DciA family protein [Rikenellaceae bacterium]
MKRSKTILIGDALSEFFNRPYIAARIAEGSIDETWRVVVGDRVADYTTELRFENHILHVRIASGLLRNEIFAQRNAIMNQINDYAKIRIVNAIIVR